MVGYNLPEIICSQMSKLKCYKPKIVQAYTALYQCFFLTPYICELSACKRTSISVEPRSGKRI